MKNSRENLLPTANPENSAIRFWERGRLLYNALLATVVFLWLILTWPHFRPALTLPVLAAMSVLALLANLCYSTAYLADMAMRQLLPATALRRARQILWLLGTLFALVFENYWIADEIYSDVTNGSPHPFQGMNTMTTPMASNMNFPAPLAVLGFLAAAGILIFALAAIFIFWFARKPKYARRSALTVAVCAAIYLVLLFAFSLSSRETVLAHGQEKYFCEIDCHLAYSVLDVKSQADGHTVITVRTRFDETTTSPSRPKDAPLTPSPREVRLLDAAGREYAPLATTGTPLLTPLKPAESYTTELEFNLPHDAGGLRLLISTRPAWPDHLVIGDENSLLHKKTFLAL